MRASRVRAAVLLFLACLLAPPMPSALAHGQVGACLHGGYADYVNPATGDAFANQRQCIRFVARGGALVPVPVVYPVTIAEVTTTGNLGPVGDPEGHSACGGTRLSLYGYGVHTVELSAEGVPGYVAAPDATYTAQFVDGFWSVSLGNTVNGQPITVTVDGEEIGTATPDCGPVEARPTL